MEGMGRGVTDSGFWRNQNVFVTGCTGLLGAWLTEALADAGANVTGLIRDWVPRSRLFAETGLYTRINTVRGDVEDLAAIERTLNEYEVETVLHLAAQTIVGIANRNPLSTFRTNIGGTWNLLEACRRVPGVKRIIVASSDKAYGNQPVLPYDEDTSLAGTHPYDVSKSCADLVAKSYYVTYGLPVCVTRCGNLYGGGDLNFNRLVPGTIRSVLNGERPLIRSDGTYIRDYFYVKDGAYAYMHLAERMKAGLYGEAFNFSNEIQVTVTELVEKLTALMGRPDLRPVIQGEAKHEIIHQYLSAQKAKRVIGWEPRYTLEEGLSETIAWYRKHIA